MTKKLIVGEDLDLTEEEMEQYLKDILHETKHDIVDNYVAMKSVRRLSLTGDMSREEGFVKTERKQLDAKRKIVEEIILNHLEGSI
jgi:hypothetical protein